MAKLSIWQAYRKNNNRDEGYLNIVTLKSCEPERYCRGQTATGKHGTDQPFNNTGMHIMQCCRGSQVGECSFNFHNVRLQYRHVRFCALPHFSNVLFYFRDILLDVFDHSLKFCNMRF
jgi:hypothetical protein